MDLGKIKQDHDAKLAQQDQLNAAEEQRRQNLLAQFSNFAGATYAAFDAANKQLAELGYHAGIEQSKTCIALTVAMDKQPLADADNNYSSSLRYGLNDELDKVVLSFRPCQFREQDTWNDRTYNIDELGNIAREVEENIEFLFRQSLMNIG